jgi:hypothetical protein
MLPYGSPLVTPFARNSGCAVKVDAPASRMQMSSGAVVGETFTKRMRSTGGPASAPESVPASGDSAASPTPASATEPSATATSVVEPPPPDP